MILFICLIQSDNLPNLRTYNYTSSNIWTKSTFGYGKIEARVKIPKGKGFFPAFWTFSDNPDNEIDIFEFWNELDFWNNYDASKLSKVHNMTIHNDYDNDGNNRMCLVDYTGVDFSQDFHTFTVIWEKNKIQWLVDGVVKRTDYRYYTILGQPITNCTIEMGQLYMMNIIYPRNPMAIILNLAIQSGFDEYYNSRSPDASTIFPSQMEVDWVRYYKRNPCQDVNITSSNQFIIDNLVFNVIVGREVIINCNYSIQSGQQLDIIAKESIKLGSGFSAELGSLFNARIDPTICGSTKNETIFNDQDTIISEKLIKAQNTDITFSNEEIKIYPNPNSGKLIVDFGCIDYKNFNIIRVC